MARSKRRSHTAARQPGQPKPHRTEQPKPHRTEQPSEERRAQQQVLENTAAKESWVTRLLRAARGASGRPRPGNRDAPGAPRR